MPVQDRTTEFKACVDSIHSRSSYPGRGGTKDRLLNSPNGQGKMRGGTKSEFSRMAVAIGKEISSTTLKLQKLAQLAKRKTLFDDRPVEISELTFIIKQDIANINKQLAGLQAHVKAQQAGRSTGGKQVEEHNANVVTLLQSKLMSTSVAFKDVLEIRTQNMKETKSRTEQFVHSTSSAAIQPPSTNSLLFNKPRNEDPRYNLHDKGKARVQDSDLLALDMVSAEEGHAPGGLQELQYMDNQQDYIQSRTTAIESIESTIAELGSIFGQLAHMVAEQRETVQRIDADTTDIADNISGAQRELLKYYASISSNRWLMIKIFGAIIVMHFVFNGC
ncbi:cis-Golgi t-SNARE syntaxin [Serendipita sp. 400]|nr:cis-Golgi t-SNARE syntaxin [Serendipita sp. 400]